MDRRSNALSWSWAGIIVGVTGLAIGINGGCEPARTPAPVANTIEYRVVDVPAYVFRSTVRGSAGITIGPVVEVVAQCDPYAGHLIYTHSKGIAVIEGGCRESMPWERPSSGQPQLTPPPVPTGLTVTTSR